MCNFNNDFSFQVKKITSSNSIRPSAPRSLILKPRGQLARANCADKAQLIVWYLSCSCMLPSNARLRRDSAWSVVIFQRGSDVATSSKDKWENTDWFLAFERIWGTKSWPMAVPSTTPNVYPWKAWGRKKTSTLQSLPLPKSSTRIQVSPNFKRLQMLSPFSVKQTSGPVEVWQIALPKVQRERRCCSKCGSDQPHDSP